MEIQDETGRRLVRRRLPESVVGIGQLHTLLAEHLSVDAEPSQVVVGMETDRGPWVRALLAAGYHLYAINPLSAARYRERHVTSGAMSDPGTRRCWPICCGPTASTTGRSPATASSPRPSRSSRGPIRARLDRQRQANVLRSTLPEFYRGALLAFDDLASRDALTVLAEAPTREQGRALRVLDRAGRAGRPVRYSKGSRPVPQVAWPGWLPMRVRRGACPCGCFLRCCGPGSLDRTSLPGRRRGPAVRRPHLC